MTVPLALRPIEEVRASRIINLDIMSDDQVVVDETTQSTNDDTSATQEVKYEVGGQELTGDELVENYKKLQKAYTQKSQELADKGKAPEAESQELQDAKQQLKDL